MRIRPGVIIAVAAVLAIVFGGRYLGWFGGKGSGPDQPATEVAANPEQPTAVNVTPAPPGQTQVSAQARPFPNPASVAARSPQPEPAPVPETGMIQDWEQRIDTLLTTPGDEAAKGREILAMLPRMPEDGQVEAAQHVSNLLADEDFKLLTPSLTNAALPEAVLDVFITDVLNRPNELKLPALLEVARVANHPKAEEARDILEVYVDENYGQDWAAWETAVTKWLKENPDQ